MEIWEYLRVFARRWWLIAMALLVLPGATYFLSVRQQPIYETVTTLVASPNSTATGPSNFLQGLDTLSGSSVLLDTFGSVLTSQSTINQAAKQAGLSPEELKQYKVNAKISPTANVIDLTVDGPDPSKDAALSYQIGALSIPYIKNLYQLYDLKILDGPTNAVLVSPKLLQNMGLAVFAAIALGMVLAFLAEYLRLPDDQPIEQNILDPLTGTYNEPYFSQRLTQEIARAKRQGYSLSVGILRVENLGSLKGRNATELRNEALRQIAERLQPELRPEDLFARVSRDQFALLFPDLPGFAAKEMMSHLQTCIEATPFQLDGENGAVNLNTSSGVMSSRDGLGSAELMVRAIQALRRAERRSGAKVQLWDEQENYAA